MSAPHPANTPKSKERTVQSTTAIRNDLVQQLTNSLLRIQECSGGNNGQFKCWWLQLKLNFVTDIPTYPFINTRGCWWVLSATRKETSSSDQTQDLFNILPMKFTTLVSPLILQATQKKNPEGCPSNQVSAAATTSASDEKWRPINCVFSPENRW